MFTDILDGNNYLFVNKRFVKLIGLHPAVYCSELFRYARIAQQNKQYIDKKYIMVDRDAIYDCTGITAAEQILIEKGLVEFKLIEIHKTKENCIALDDDRFEVYLAQTDKLNKEEARSLKAYINKILQPKKVKREGVIKNLQDSIVIDNPELKAELDSWVASICRNSKKLSKEAIQLFIQTILNYSQDIPTLIKVVQSARIHNYVDAEFAINNVDRKEKATIIKIESKRGSIKDFEEGDKF